MPKIEVDLGARLRMHFGRPLWQLETYPQLTQWGGPADGVIDPGGTGQIVGVSDPVYLPTQALLGVARSSGAGECLPPPSVTCGRRD